MVCKVIIQNNTYIQGKREDHDKGVQETKL